jgi:hypothetical protein
MTCPPITLPTAAETVGDAGVTIGGADTAAFATWRWRPDALRGLAD